MRLVFLICLSITSGYISAQPDFQLAPPMLKYASGFFAGSTSFEVIFDQPGASVRYTLNGSEPTEKDALYSKPVTITKRTIVKARAFGKDFSPSETVTAHFIANGKSIRKIGYSKPNESYANAKPDILNDNAGGIVNYRAGTWLGYDNDTVNIDIELQKKEKISSVLVNLLQDENSWIFMPEEIRLFYFDDKKKTFLPAGSQSFTHENPGPKQCNTRELKPTTAISSNKLRLVFTPLKKIPDWHNGKGNHGWLFIDEIKVY